MQDSVPAGRLEGWVLDPTLRPVVDAVVRVEGMASVRTDATGHYAVETEWPLRELLVIAEAAGFHPVSRTIAPHTSSSGFQINFTLDRIATDAWIETQSLKGFIACGAIVQVGHNHGGGSPDDDRHVSCPEAAGEGKQFLPYTPERDPTDMVIEVFWRPNSRLSEFITLILWDDEGELVQFTEGSSPVRLEVGRALVKERFQDGRSGTIELRPGIADDDPPGEVYYALHIDQPFDVFASTSHRMVLPAGWTVDA